MKATVVRVPVNEDDLDLCIGLLAEVLRDKVAHNSLNEKLQELERLAALFIGRYGWSGIEFEMEGLSAIGTEHGGIFCHPTQALLELSITLRARETQ